MQPTHLIIREARIQLESAAFRLRTAELCDNGETVKTLISEALMMIRTAVSLFEGK